MTATCHPLRRAVQPLVRRAAPDADLVARFVEDRDQPAFAELVRRHGPGVLAVCRHVTRHHHDADDAFQATFLVLARKAHALDPARPLAAWLRGVAVRAGKKAARRRPTLPLGEVARPECRSDGEAVAAVRAAVAALPAHQRQAVERCELLGQPRAEVASELGIRPGTLSSRLALARRALAARLARQGFAPVVVPAALARATASEVSSRRVVELAEAVMRVNWYGWAMGLVLAVGGAVGVGLAGEPAPMPRRAEVKANEGRILLMVRAADGRSESYLWVDPDGGRPTRLSIAEVRRAGADLYEMIYLDGIVPRRATSSFPSGALRPNGDMPFHTRKGIVLLTPSDPPTVRPLTPTPVGGWDVVAWSADGWRCVFRGHDGDRTTHTLVDIATGDTTPLPVPDGYLVCGWCETNGWLLATPGDERNVLDRLTSDAPHEGRYVKLPLDGRPPAEFPGGKLFQPVLSPDGRLVAHVRPETVGGRKGQTLEVADLAGGRSPVFHCSGATSLRACWAPDGRRLVVQEWFGPLLGRRNAGKTWVCDLDGRKRELPATGVPVGWR